MKSINLVATDEMSVLGLKRSLNSLYSERFLFVIDCLGSFIIIILDSQIPYYVAIQNISISINFGC